MVIMSDKLEGFISYFCDFGSFTPVCLSYSDLPLDFWAKHAIIDDQLELTEWHLNQELVNE